MPGLIQPTTATTTHSRSPKHTIALGLWALNQATAVTAQVVSSLSPAEMAQLNDLYVEANATAQSGVVDRIVVAAVAALGTDITGQGDESNAVSIVTSTGDPLTDVSGLAFLGSLLAAGIVGTALKTVGIDAILSVLEAILGAGVPLELAVALWVVATLLAAVALFVLIMLIAAFIDWLVEGGWDDIVDAVEDAWDAIVDACKAVVTWVGGLCSKNGLCGPFLPRDFEMLDESVFFDQTIITALAGLQVSTETLLATRYQLDVEYDAMSQALSSSWNYDVQQTMVRAVRVSLMG